MGKLIMCPLLHLPVRLLEPADNIPLQKKEKASVQLNRPVKLLRQFEVASLSVTPRKRVVVEGPTLL